MSLINDALKKAQKQRTGDAAPLSTLPNVGGESPAHLSRGRANTPGGLYVGLGLGAIAVVGLIIAAILLFRSGPPAAPAIAEATAPARPADLTPSTPPERAPAAAPATPNAGNMFVVPIAAPAEKPGPVASAPQPSPETKSAGPTGPAAAPAPAATTDPSGAAPAAPGRMDPRAVQFLDGIKVAGIRASATDSKVLMNDRVYRVGDMVGYEFGVRLVGITASSLTFEDAEGARYTRNF